LPYLDQLLDGSFRLERQQGHAVSNVAPLSLIRDHSESQAQLIDDGFGLPLLLDVAEDVVHDAAIRFFLDGMLANGQMTYNLLVEC
jgi:hypothetical protein